MTTAKASSKSPAVAVVEFNEPSRRWKGSSQFTDLLMPIEGIGFDPDNLREHGDFNIQAIATSLKRFGQWEALIVRSNGQLVAGEGRILAVQADEGLHWTHVAAIVFDGPERDARDLAALLNRTPELASWDRENLAVYLENSRQEQDLTLLGWRDDDVRAVMASIGQLGKSEASFLDDIASQGDGADPRELMKGTGFRAEPQPRELTFPISEEERKEAIEALRTLQQRYQTATLTTTLLAALRVAMDA